MAVGWWEQLSTHASPLERIPIAFDRPVTFEPLTNGFFGRYRSGLVAGRNPPRVQHIAHGQPYTVVR
jgi:hypothetical protein